jgi:alkaline phosphatase D
VSFGKSFTLSRRDALRALGTSLLLTTPARLLRASESVRFATNPFPLGVASGYPSANGVVLWTRLLAASEDSHHLTDAAIPVKVEIATDEKFRKVIRTETLYATPEWAHSIHAEIAGLKPSREYWFRFTAGGQQSAVGRTRTAPKLSANIKRLCVGVASCQKYENGYFVAYRHMLNDNLDLIVHTGDYIYEYASTPGGNNVRGDGSGETFTLEDYRARHALYKRDPDLQAMHAAHPWLVTWDDHEVTNDYAGENTYEASGKAVLLRRAAAYRAYYEHMPLPSSAKPVGPHMQLYAQCNYGRLLQINVLDSRQYRSPLGCRGPEDTGGNASCASLFDATRTKLGELQEHWLGASLKESRARWNVLVQGTPMAHVDGDPGEGIAYRRDIWDGYPAARQRVLDALANTKTSNPIVIDGDIHAFQVAHINRIANDLSSPVIASEFTTDSITSGGISQARLDQNRSINPNLLYSYSQHRGYMTLEFERNQVRADLVTVESIREQNAGRNLLASFVVENGKPGPVKV